MPDMDNLVVAITQQVSSMPPNNVHLPPFTLSPQQPIQHSQPQPQPQVQEKPGNRRGRKPGAKGYTSKKVRTLLNLLREHLPIGGEGWQLVADEYNKNERESRFVDALRERFNEYVNMRYSMGDPTKSSLVRDAQEIDVQIQSKCTASHIGLTIHVPPSLQSHHSDLHDDNAHEHLHEHEHDQQVLSGSPSPSVLSATGSPTSSSTSSSSSTSTASTTNPRKRKPEDAVWRMVEREDTTSLTAALVSLVDRMLATVERLQQQQQQFITNILSQQLQRQ